MCFLQGILVATDTYSRRVPKSMGDCRCQVQFVDAHIIYAPRISSLVAIKHLASVAGLKAEVSERTPSTDK